MAHCAMALGPIAIVFPCASILESLASSKPFALVAAPAAIPVAVSVLEHEAAVTVAVSPIAIALAPFPIGVELAPHAVTFT
jgi:hypothetical protein